ncbi:MAG: hypothetical protein REH83_02425 [Rickettsiella sp.]|nr:hypothetical protein [Rickettsiella sp.]
MVSVTMKLDTLAWVKKLEQAGIPAQHAEAQVELLANVIENTICTKKDLDVKLNVLELNLKSKLVESKHELIKWFVGTFILAIGVSATFIKLFLL